ncbi:MAG: FAD-dependent oxidoreductase [Dehalococcoidia bacterium]
MRTIGGGHVLLPWGATDRISRMIDATEPEDITFAAVECRKLVMAEVDRLKAEVPGFEDAHLCHIADQLDVTESRRLVGEYVLTREDMDQTFDDTVAVTGHWTKYGSLYDIPYRSLLAKEYSNLLTAGRCISVDHRTHHATKEIPACMATGEAGRCTAAAMAAMAGTAAKTLDVRASRRGWNRKARSSGRRGASVGRQDCERTAAFRNARRRVCCGGRSAVRG